MSMTWLFDKAKGSSHSEWKMLSCHVQLQNHHTSLALIREEISILKCAKEGYLIATAKWYEKSTNGNICRTILCMDKGKKILVNRKEGF